jgi:transcriptional regulator with XRE-family HTH domain
MRNSEKQLIQRLGLAIAERRRVLGLSQLDLAKKAGLHRTYISDIERGNRNVTIIVIERIAESLGTASPSLLRLALPEENSSPAG